MLAPPHQRRLFALALVVWSGMAAAQPAPPCAARSPVDGPLVLTSDFGQRQLPDEPRPRSHNGVDIRAAEGTRLYAIEGGRILHSGSSPTAGENVRLLGASGTLYWYMHLSRPFFSTGEAIGPGDVLGLSGNTGHNVPPHLHLEVRPGGGQPINPRTVLCMGFATVPGFTVRSQPSINGDGPAIAANLPADTPADQVPPSGAFPTAGWVPPSAPAPNWEGMSLMEVMQSESTRRFLSPRWMQALYDPISVWREDPRNEGKPPPPLGDMRPVVLREITQMMVLSTMIANERQRQRDRIESLVAGLAAIRTEERAEGVLARTRAAAVTPVR